MITTAKIKIWGHTVGAVSWDQASDLGYFQYDSQFLKKGIELSPLVMPLHPTKVYRFPELRTNRTEGTNTFNGMPGLLADSLPDSYGNQMIDAWLARNGRAPGSMNPVEKLCFLGTRAMGALSFEPSTEQIKQNNASLEMNSLVNVARAMLQKREAFSTQMNDDEGKAVGDILQIGTSAGGARPKAVIAFNEETGEVRSGQTTADNGFRHWLIKLDGVSDVQLGDSHGYGRVEMAYYKMATAAGITMMPCRLLEENGRAHFMTMRFDRDAKGNRHHIQTFCAMRHFDFNWVGRYSYEQLFQTMRLLRLPYPDAEQMYRRMVFNILAKNCDDHTKNFAFGLKEGGTWALAPAYDVCYAYREDSVWVSQHALTMNGKREGFTYDDFWEIGDEMNIKKVERIVQEVREAVEQWPKFAEKSKVNESIAKRIQKNQIPIR